MPIFSIKMPSWCIFSQILPHGCFGYLIDGESGPWVKTLLQAWKWAQPCRKQTSDHTFITFWIFPFKPLKNGLKNGENLFFAEIDETLGRPSTCPYDSIWMPSMVKNTDTKALITSLGRNTKMTTQCYRNRTGHRTGEAQNVNWTWNRTGTGKKLGKKPAD